MYMYIEHVCQTLLIKQYKNSASLAVDISSAFSTHKQQNSELASPERKVQHAARFPPYQPWMTPRHSLDSEIQVINPWHVAMGSNWMICDCDCDCRLIELPIVTDTLMQVCADQIPLCHT